MPGRSRHAVTRVQALVPARTGRARSSSKASSERSHMARVAKDRSTLIASSFAEPPRDEGHFLSVQGGRRAGSQNKLGQTFIADLCSDWIEHGVEAIKNVRENKPEAYLRVVASLLPKQPEIQENVFDG